MSMAARAPPSRQLDALAEAAATLDPTAIPSSKKASTAGSAEYVSSHTVQATIPVLFKGQQREEVDAAVARFIIETGSPFSLVDSNAFHYMVQALVNCNIPSYSPPSSYRVSHKLLDDEYERVQSGLESYFAGIPTTGVTLISDGWSNINGATLLNFLAHTPAGVVFLWSINTKGMMSCIVCVCVCVLFLILVCVQRPRLQSIWHRSSLRPLSSSVRTTLSRSLQTAHPTARQQVTSS